MLTENTRILLTGVTGLIGGELARLLLRSPVGKVFCLVRPRPQQNAQSRLVERLLCTERASERVWKKVGTVAGDVASPDFGLSKADYDRITQEVDLIIHCASELSFIHDANVRRTNIAGMQNLIGLTRACRRAPLIVHLSTVASCGAVTHRCMKEEDGSDPENAHHNEYTRSKAIGEKVLRDSQLPCLILRPSITLSAGLPSLRFARAIAWFLPLLQDFEAIPIDPESRVDVVPVSFVAESILGLLQKDRLAHDCYNLSAGPEAATICREGSEFLDRHYERAEPLQLIPPAAWTRDMHRGYVNTPERRKAFATLRYYLPFLNMDVTYDNGRLRRELGAGSPEVRPLTAYLGDLLTLLGRSEPVANAVG